MSHFLSPRDLAAALGVSESSLKRWVDAGRIPASKTSGGHRRIARADALAFVRATGMPVAQPHVLGIGVVEARRHRRVPKRERELYDAILTGDRDTALTWCREERARGLSTAVLCDGPLRDAMHAIGELWNHDPDGLLVEHRATDLCIQLVATLRAELTPPANAPIAIGASPEGDPYVLSSAMVALTLAEAGFRTVNLGADTPSSTLQRAVAQYRPALLWLTVSTPLTPARAHELAAFLVGLPAQVIGVVGGRQAGAVAAADPRVRKLDSMAALVDLANQL